MPSALPLNAAGGEWGFLSIVLMKNTSVRPAWLPWSPVVYDQINLRTYVRDPQTGEEAVFFIESAINSRLMLFGPRLFNLPWQYMPLTFRSFHDSVGDGATYVAGGRFHDPIDIEVRAAAAETGAHDFAADETIRHITTPKLGFMASGNGLRRFRVSYPRVPPATGRLLRCRFPYAVAKGLLTEEEVAQPATVFVVERIDFLVLMPPVWLASGAAGEKGKGGG